MHVLTVVADNLSPERLLAAVKHWAAKFEQEILNTDAGPNDRGVYEFEHDGMPTAVHWNPVSTFNHMQPQSGEQAGYLMAKFTDDEIEKIKGAGPGPGYIMTGKASPNFKPDPDLYGNEEPLADSPEMNPEAAAAINEAIQGEVDAQQRRRDDDTITRPVDPAADATNPAETAQQMGEQPGSTAADVAAAVAPDLA